MEGHSGISSSVIAFVESHLPSLEHLELLAVLMQSPDRWWDADVLGQELGIGRAIAGRILEQLASGNLLAIRVTGDVRYQFQPGEANLRAAAEEFAVVYGRQHLALVQLITQRSQRSIRDFAEAFRIRRHDDR